MMLAHAEALLISHRTYRVSWEWNDHGVLRGDHTPERNEPAFGSEDEAWALAEKLARALGEKIVNVHVVDDRWNPVDGYQARMLNPYRGRRA